MLWLHVAGCSEGRNLKCAKCHTQPTPLHLFHEVGFGFPMCTYQASPLLMHLSQR